MATKQTPKKLVKQKGEMTLDTLADLIVQGFGDLQDQINGTNNRIDSMESKIDSMEHKIDSMGKRMDSMENRMMSMQEHILSIETEIKSIKIELLDINRRLDLLEESVRDVRGYAKEIDDLRARVKYLEQYIATHAKQFA